MAIFRVVIWYPSRNQEDPPWESLSLNDKLSALEAAIRDASGLFTGGQFQGIFVAPEYVLTGDGPSRDCQTPIPLERSSQLFKHLETLSATIPRVLFFPGSMMVLSGTNVQNRMVGYYEGDSTFFCGKKDDVGEAGAGNTFSPGNGGAIASIQDKKVGIQICRDAIHGGSSSYLQGEVEIQVVAGSGIGFEAIGFLDPEPRVLIVADQGSMIGGVQFSQTKNVARKETAMEESVFPSVARPYGFYKTCVVDYAD